jgi:nucleoside 2-deoxyribosyltransferase
MAFCRGVNSLKIYISGALKGSKDIVRARAKYEQIAAAIRLKGLNPYLPHQTTDPMFNASASPEFVYAKDCQAINESDAAVLVLDEPSLGVGLEIGMFVQSRIPLLVLCEKEQELSRFAAGFLTANNIKIVRYTEDIAEVVGGWIVNDLLCSQVLP